MDSTSGGGAPPEAREEEVTYRVEDEKMKSKEEGEKVKKRQEDSELNVNHEPKIAVFFLSANTSHCPIYHLLLRLTVSF